MASTEVQRTLVKSPPELWAELSDPAALARHLGELGDIELTRVEPESAVEWEAENVKGSVQLKASGWGTKVTLSLTREPPAQAVAEPEHAAVEPEPTAAEPEVVVEPVAVESEPPIAESEPPIAESEPLEPEPAPQSEPEPTPRRSFFARLFKRRRKEPVAKMPEPSEVPSESEAPEAIEPIAETAQDDLAQAPADAAVQEPPALQADPVVQPDATPEPQTETAAETPDLAAELAAVEQTMVEQDTALLTAVLDRLGAAHHRPFSRG